MKIISVDNVTSEGATFTFDCKFALNDNLKTNIWYLSWDKLSELISDALRE